LENQLIFGEETDKGLRLTFWATLYISSLSVNILGDISSPRCYSVM